MNKNILVGVIILILAAGAVGVSIYFSKNGDGYVSAPEGAQPAGTEPAEPTSRLVVRDDFSLNVPEGWIETGAPPGVSLIMMKNDENVTNPDAKKINFKTYFSVSFDVLAGNTKEKYVEILENGLKQSIPEAVIAKRGSIAINGRETEVLEADVRQQGLDFKVLMFVIWGKDKDVWIVSFNTLKENLDDYEDLFYRIAGSFGVK